jgi:predicted transcriptional regulator
MSGYVSDVTVFINELLEKNPKLVEEQRKNRATWWDKKLDRDELKRQEASEAPKQPYAYFPLPKAEK